MDMGKFAGGPFYQHRSTLIPIWISNHMDNSFEMFEILGMDKWFHPTFYIDFLSQDFDRTVIN